MATTQRNELNRVKFSGFDFETIFDDLRSQMQAKFASDFNDFALSSLAIMLLDITSFGLDTLSFYLDRRATETYLVTARTRKAVARISRQLGYKMGGAVASSVDMTVTFPASVDNLPIPAGFQFKGPSNVIFEAAQAVSVAPADTNRVRTVPAYEGTTLQETFVSDGTANQQFQLRRIATGRFVVQGSVSVVVDGTPYVESELLTFDTTEQFELGYNDDPPTVRFGDGAAGLIPVAPASIVVTYVASLGLAGQVSRLAITDVVEPLVVNFNAIDLVVVNNESSSGGDDPETLEHTKAFAGRVFNSQHRAITADDYESLAGAYADPLYGRVAVARAQSSRSAESDGTLQGGLVAINQAIAPIQAAVNLEVQAAQAALAGAYSALDIQQATYLSSIAGAANGTNVSLGITLTDLRSAQASAGEINVTVGNIPSHVFTGQSGIDAVATVPAAADSLSAATKAALKALFDPITADATSISTANGNVTSKLNTQIAAVPSMQTGLQDGVGFDLFTPGTPVYLADQVRLTVIGTIGTAGTGVDGNLVAITAAVLPLSTTGTVTGSVAVATQAIFDHVDLLLSDASKANLVSVPILVRDGSGFYIGPSIGLIQSLQAYLDARKEVTQTVAVVSGAAALVRAVLTVRVGVDAFHSLQATQASTLTVLDDLLRDRAFGRALYLSDIEALVALIPGVVFTNPTISGHLDTDLTTVLTNRTDTSGNLVCLSGEVITKGTVSVSVELAPT